MAVERKKSQHKSVGRGHQFIEGGVGQFCERKKEKGGVGGTWVR